MSFIEVLREARNSAVAALQEFKVSYPKYPQAVHVFFEGQSDRAFYAGFLAARTGAIASVRTYDCKGKPQLLALYDRIRAQYGDSDRLLFFLDKDLDDLLNIELPNDPRVFVTETYSIENYLVCEEILHRWIDEAYRFSGVTFALDPVRSQFRMQLSRFHQLCTVVMAWVLTHRKAGTRPNLSNVQCSRLFAFDDSGSIQRSPGAIAVLDQLTGVSTSAPMLSDIRRNARKLQSHHPKSYIRGKFELWFLVAFIRNLEDLMKRVCAETGGSVRTSTVLHEANAIDLLAPRLQSPESLRTFLDRHSAVLGAAA
jgi:hypothetical protein